MKTNKVYSENPEYDIWSSLNKFTYMENLRKYFHEKEVNVEEDLLETISGSIAQAYEYFTISRTSSLQVSPLLLYYGATNLLYGVSCLLSGQILKADGHGMKLNIKSINKQISESEISFNNISTGGASVYLRSLSKQEIDLSDSESWTIEELLGSIVEIIPDFYNLYGNNSIHVIPLKKINTNQEVQFRTKQNLYGDGKIEELISKIPQFKNNYLNPQVNYTKEIIMRKKMNGKNLTQISYTGEYFISVGHNKNNKKIILPYFMYIFSVLYAFGDLCRYHPKIWNPFVLRDNTGERNLIEKFCYIARRTIPNIMLNLIHEQEIIYSSDIYKDVDAKVYLSKEEVERLIVKELNKRSK